MNDPSIRFHVNSLCNIKWTPDMANKVGKGWEEGLQHFITTSAGIRKELWAIAGHRVNNDKSVLLLSEAI